MRSFGQINQDYCRRNRRRRRNPQNHRRTDALGRDISVPYWYKRLPKGQQCECDVDEFDVERSQQKTGYSDSLVKYMKCSCPECGEEFGHSDYVIEG